MILRQGITGFWHAKGPSLPGCDVSTFRTHCFAAARRAGGKIRRNDRRSDAVAANFTFEVIELSGGPVAVLLNLHFPVIGFAVAPAGGSHGGPIEFVDHDLLAESLSAADKYEVLSRAALECALSQQEVQLLSSVEIEQVQYWKPVRVGDVVFNFWD